MVKKLGLMLLLLMPAALLAQSPQSATGGGASLWGGGEFSTFNPDYGGCVSLSPFTCNTQLRGPTASVDFNFRPKWGVEGEARWLRWNGYGIPNKNYEDSYLIGPRYRAFRFHRLEGWAKALGGGGWIRTPGYPTAGTLKGSYFVFALGGTLQYPLTRRLWVRGGYEFQDWPSFAGPPSYTSTGAVQTHNNGLTPNGFSVGFMYRILGPQ